MKRFVAGLLVVLLSVASFIGVTDKMSSSVLRAMEKQLYGTASNDIKSYERIDPNKTQIVVGVVASDDVKTLFSGFEAQYPDVQVIMTYLQVGTKQYSPAAQWVYHGYTPDIVANLDLGTNASKYQVELSSQPFASSYYPAALEPYEQNGHLYSLPGPSKMIAIAYNKTLFAEHGWTVPATFDEFISLCDRIDTDTGGQIQAYNPNGKYVLDFTAGMEAFAYGQLFAGTSNSAWYTGFLNGNTNFAGHMEPYFQMQQALIDHGLIRQEHFDYSYTTLTNEFRSGALAMMPVATDVSLTSANGYEVGYMAFPSTNGGADYVVQRANYSLSEMARSRTDAQQRAVDEFMSYVSTPQAQKDYIGNALMVSNLKNAGKTDSPYFADLADQIENGHTFTRMDFTGGAISPGFDMLSVMREQTMAMTEGKKDVSQAIAACDKAADAAIRNQTSSTDDSETIGRAESDFTVLETSEYVADIFRAKTGADIALIPDNSTYRGNIHRIFAGDITAACVTNMLPRSFDNGATLVKVKMTGSQLMNALNDPPGYESGAADCVYAFSGLKASVDPWNAIGGKYLSVTMADGTPLDPDTVYTVAFWKGMVRNAYITDTVESYKDTYVSLLSDAIRNAGTISPVEDGRMTLIWS